MLTIAIGDIHGMADKFDQLLERVHGYLAEHHPHEPFRFVFLGDYIDRGPDSAKVLYTLQALQKDGAICLRGNHEELLIRSCRSASDLIVFLRNGGVETFASLETEERIIDAMAWAASLPLTHEDERRLFVHAGMRPAVPIDRQRPQDLLWIRSAFLDYPGPFPKYVVHGHSPTLLMPEGGRQPQVLPHRCNLDTGAVYGGPLSAAIFSVVQQHPLAILTTDPSPNNASILTLPPAKPLLDF